MADPDVLLNKIFKLVDLQKQCARKFNSLANELEETTKTANVTKVVGSSVSVGGATAITVAGLLTVVTGGAALPVLAAVGGAGVLASGTGLVTSISSEAVVANKSKEAMKEAEQIVGELQELGKEIQDLMKLLKPGAEEGQPSGSCDDEDGEANIMEQLLRAEAKQQGLNLPHSVKLHRMCGSPKANFSRMIMVISALLAVSLTVLLQVLMFTAKEGGKKMAKSVGKRVASKAAGCAVGGAVGLLLSVPELVSDCQNLDICETEASKTLREKAKAVQTAAEEIEEVLKKNREALQKLVRIKLIIKKKNRSSDEKRELIQYVIDITQDEVVRQWLRENQESEHFFKLLDLFNFTQEKIDEEEKKKEKTDLNLKIDEEEKKKEKTDLNLKIDEEEKKKIHLIFVAHGDINNWMIPARCLLLLPSITDVILYSPWNCLLTPEAAYGIATGRIEPGHRQFGCAEPEYCPRPDFDHEPSGLPDHWNSMRDSGFQWVPVIMVSPVGKPGDRAFSEFLSLKARYGEPGEDRYVIPYLIQLFGRVPFFVVTLVISLVYLFSKYEPTVHLAACLGKTSAETSMKEIYLMQQYCYTVDNTGMDVRPDSIHIRDHQLFNILRAVFG